jgi:hypothetical protein
MLNSVGWEDNPMVLRKSGLPYTTVLSRLKLPYVKILTRLSGQGVRLQIALHRDVLICRIELRQGVPFSLCYHNEPATAKDKPHN